MPPFAGPGGPQLTLDPGKMVGLYFLMSAGGLFYTLPQTALLPVDKLPDTLSKVVWSDR